MQVFFAGLVAVSNASALPFSGDEVTIYDGDGANGIGPVKEDNEAEPGMVQAQKWDLEGFFIHDNHRLAITGGFDFKNGVSGYDGAGNNKNFLAGDIFISTDSDYIAGNSTGGTMGQPVVNTTFGYEYVIDVDWATGDYDIRALTASSYTQEAWYTQNHGSNPWLYIGEDANGSTVADSIFSGSFHYLTNDDAGYGSDFHQGMNGDDFHNAAWGFDLSPIIAAGNPDLIFHSTMGCGNDNLMGQAEGMSVPEPSSIALLGLGVIGLAAMRKRNN